MTKTFKSSLLVLMTSFSIFSNPLVSDAKTDNYKKFSGTIGNKLKIEMIINTEGKKIIGFYHYDKVKKNLKLKGNIDEINNVEIKEYDEKGNQTGVFKYNILDEDKIEGGWSKPDGSGSLTVRLEEVKGSSLKTQLLDKSLKKSLLGSHKCSLQWISWKDLGKVSITDNDGTLFVNGKQEDKSKGNYLTINGRFLSINKDELVFLGEVITKVDHIAGGKPCKKEGLLTFKKTGGRNFWRMQEMNNECDGVTDYVDISL